MKFMLWLLLPAAPALAQTVLPELDPREKPGDRPYEMAWAHRAEPASPTVRFDDLHGWKLDVEGAAQGSLEASRARNLWERPVGKLRYRVESKSTNTPRLTLLLPQPVELPVGADAVDMWVYGNRWDWEHPPGTPPVRIALRLRDRDQQRHAVLIDQVRWQEWWLMHKRLPQDLPAPLRLEAVEISGGTQTEWRELFFDSIRFYREESAPLRFTQRPRRNLALATGQSPGANLGSTKLPFPTREETILPMHQGGSFWTRVKADDDGFTFRYRGQDSELVYHFNPREGLGSLRAEANGQPVGALTAGAAVRRSDGSTNVILKSDRFAPGLVEAEYADGTRLRLQLWQKSLVVDVANASGLATELSFGQLAGLESPRTIWVPYLTYGGGPHPCVLLSRAGTNPVFTSLWLDWYRSNGSEPYAAESAGTNSARINGGVRYLARTDGRRNPMFERLFLTVSPVFEEVLPTVPNPVGLHAPLAADRLWQESWGPENYAAQEKRSEMLRAYGIEKLIQCNHEIAWRDGGESFTLRTRAAPGRGGDAALQRYVAHQRGLGWLAGLYSNYTDYAPVNEFWDPDGVQRLPDGNWRLAWPRCWAEKPLKAVEFDALLAPQIKAKFNPNSAYTDVQTAVSPWGYNDYDARVPGAGTFAQTFYAYGELLRNDSRVYGGPIFSEGTYHWLYAGLADGNYALAYDGRPLANEPLLPAFDLYQIHPRECDIGMGWTANFCDAIPNWRAPENLDRAIDRFLLHTLAYGHIGWLVEEEHGLARACRSYYMLQQVQARYGLKPPQRIAYWDGTRLRTVSEALVQELPRTRRQLYIEYPGGLKLWLNDHPAESWRVQVGADELVLPPAGWAAVQGGDTLFSYSALRGGAKADYLRSPAYTYLDGRGHALDVPEAVSNGALAITPAPRNQLRIIRISGTGAFTIRRPYRVRGECIACEAFDVEGRRLTAPRWSGTAGETQIEPVDKAVRYLARFGAKR